MQILGRSATSLIAFQSCFASLQPFQICRMLATQSPDQVVDDVINFVRTGCQGNTQQATDILNTGLAHQTGNAHTRLQLAMAEVQAASCNWAAVIEHTLSVAEQSPASGDSLAAKLQMEASLVCVRALLTRGCDADAIRLAKQTGKRVPSWFPGDRQSQPRLQAEVEANTSLLGVLHATGDFKAAALCEELVTGPASRSARIAADVSDASTTAARAQVMALRLAMGQHDVFRQLFAVDLDAEGPAATQDDDKQAPVTQGPEQHSSTDMRPAHWQQAVAAQLLVMEAQAAAAQQQWDRAEERLAKALNLTEQLHGGNSQTPQVGVVLGMLGHTYARSKRITLAEGLHRQAVRLLKLNPESTSTSSDALSVHTSLASAAAWRYAQLLSALPKRDTEALAWREFAVRHWQAMNDWSQGTEIEKLLGPLDVLKSGKDESSGIIVDLMLLRGLPCSSK